MLASLSLDIKIGGYSDQPSSCPLMKACLLKNSYHLDCFDIIWKAYIFLRCLFLLSPNPRTQKFIAMLKTKGNTFIGFNVSHFGQKFNAFPSTSIAFPLTMIPLYATCIKTFAVLFDKVSNTKYVHSFPLSHGY